MGVFDSNVLHSISNPVDVRQSETARPFLLMQQTIPLTGLAGGNLVPVPIAATYLTLTVNGGDAYYNLVGAANATTSGVPLVDKQPKDIQATGMNVHVFGAAGYATAEYIYDPNRNSRRVIGHANLWDYPGYGWPVSAIPTDIGGLTMEALGGAWTISDSSSAAVNSAGPGSASVDNVLVMVGDRFYGWHEVWMVLSPGGDGGLVIGAADVSNFIVIRLYASDHATKPNTVENIRRNAGVETIISTVSSATLTAKGITLSPNSPIMVSSRVVNLAGIVRAYTSINGRGILAPPNLTTGFTGVNNIRTGFQTNGTSRVVAMTQATF